MVRVIGRDREVACFHIKPTKLPNVLALTTSSTLRRSEHRNLPSPTNGPSL